jgi:hypothetical protein
MIAQRLKTDIEIYAEEMRHSALFQSAQKGRVPPSTVVAYLTGLLHLIRQTPILLEQARARAMALGHPTLAAYFENKTREESGHDRWAENDVAALSDSSQIQPPLSSIVELITYLRTAIDEEPARYLAYILFAEYFTVLIGPEWLAALENRCGVPTSSMTVVAHHIELDKAHVATGLLEIDALVPDLRLSPRLRETLHESMAYFSRFCNELAVLAA